MSQSGPCCCFVLPCFNEAKGLETTAEVLRDKVTSLSCGGGFQMLVESSLLTMVPQTALGILSNGCMIPIRNYLAV